MTTETRGPTAPPRNRRRIVVGTAVGLLAVAAALGAAELAAALARATSPVVAVGDAVVDQSPPAAMELAIELFGTADKIVLIAGILVALGAVGAGLGIAALRRPFIGYAGVAALGAAGLVALVLRRTADPSAAVSVVAGAAAGALALALLLRSAHGFTRTRGRGRTGAPAAPRSDRGQGRRGFMLTASGVFVASGTAGALGRWLPSVLDGPGSRSALDLPEPAQPLPALPVGADLDIPGLAPFTTPNADFYRIDTALTIPRLDSTRWTLRVHGMVDRPFEIDMDELLALPLEEADATLTCVSNEVGGDLVGNSRWLGFPLADLLRRAGVHSGADQILSTSDDGWTCGTPTETVMDGRDALLAVGMGGQPLPHTHGYPARMVVPGLYGFVSATKWVTDIKLTRFADEQAYWAQRDWGVRAPVKTMSRIDVPAPLARVDSGDVVVAGIAWAQNRGIDAVEVRVDEGQWQEAELAEVPGIDTWTQWVTEVDVDPGQHSVQVRATDATGFTQPAERVSPLPDGATGWHSIRFTAD